MLLECWPSIGGVQQQNAHTIGVRVDASRLLAVVVMGFQHEPAG